jgi:subtilase family serine protease
MQLMHLSPTRAAPRRHRAVLLVTVPLVLTALPASAQAAPGRRTVSSDRPTYSTSGLPSSPVSSSAPVEFRVDLALRDQAGLQQLGRAVSSPRSPSYRHYLSAAQFAARFAASTADVDSVRRHLAARGFTVVEVNPTRTSLTVTGTAAQVDSAFGAALRSYSLPGSGTLVAPEGALTLPGTIAPLVAGVRGLAASQHLTTPSRRGSDTPGVRNRPDRSDPAQVTRPQRKGGGAPPAPGFLNATPCSTYYGERTATGTPPVGGAVQPYAPCGYTPKQIRAAYGVDTALDGRGTTVAITDAYNSATLSTDVATYSARHGLPAFAKGQYSTVLPEKPFRLGFEDPVNGDQCGEQGWYGEQTLDVEAVHATAPGAKILYVASRSCDKLDFADALQTIVDGERADAISNSWGSAGEAEEAATLAAYQRIFAQAAVEGIGVYFSSGDAGDNTSAVNPTPAVDLPASSPLVTAVGGTSLGVDRQGRRTFEDGWGTGRSTLAQGAWRPFVPGPFTSGGGGGASSLFPQPDYQKGVVPDSLARKAGVGRPTRVLPDVALDADPNTGFTVGQTQTFLDGVRYSEYRIGGTSLSSPLMAGLVALADQAGGFHHGFVNPALYALAGSAFVHDPASARVRHYVVRKDFPLDPKTGISDPKGALVTSLRAINVTKSLKATQGYDDITGIGSPRGPGFLTHLGAP